MGMRTSLICVVMGLAGTACSAGPADDGVVIVAGAWPIEDLLRPIVGAAADLEPLLPAGVEPHDVELNAGDLELLERADAIVYVGGGFQPALEELVAGREHAIDVLSFVGPLRTTQDGRSDPHAWLSPSRWATVAEGVTAELSHLLPELELDGAAVAGSWRDLASSFEEGLAGCARTVVFTEHEAFGYLTDDHGLELVALAGVSPDAQGTAPRLEAAVARARATGATTVFAERMGDQRLARALAEEAGLEIARLDPLEFGTAAPETGIERMEANLAALREGLGCP